MEVKLRPADGPCEVHHFTDAERPEKIMQLAMENGTRGVNLCRECVKSCSDRVVKSCGCGRSFSSRGWTRLEYVGLQRDPYGDIELRNCACGSTIGIVVAS